jgi:hypothetical protein
MKTTVIPPKEKTIVKLTMGGAMTLGVTWTRTFVALGSKPQFSKMSKVPQQSWATAITYVAPRIATAPRRRQHALMILSMIVKVLQKELRQLVRK